MYIYIYVTCAHILDKNTEYFHAFSLFQLCSCNLKHAIIPFIKLQGSHQKFSLMYAFSQFYTYCHENFTVGLGHTWTPVGSGGGWG